MKTKLLLTALLFSITVFAGKTQKLETPYWQVIYRGNGQARIQSNARFAPEPVLDGSSNITGWSYLTNPTTFSVYGVSDNKPFVLWIENDDGKGILVVKANKKSRDVAAQYFSIVCSNSSLKKIIVKASKNSFLEKSKPIGGIIWNDINWDSFLPSVFADGDVGSISFNCDLFKTLIYAKNIGKLKFKNALFSLIVVGEADRMGFEIPTGSITNSEVIFFKSGTIDKLTARRIFNTPILAGAAFPAFYMSEATAVFSTPELSPKGSIGLFKAIEICAWGEKNNDRWFVDHEMNLLSDSSIVLASEIKKFKVKRICTENTSVYIHGR